MPTIDAASQRGSNHVHVAVNTRLRGNGNMEPSVQRITSNTQFTWDGLSCIVIYSGINLVNQMFWPTLNKMRMILFSFELGQSSFRFLSVKYL
jgi:hypothetical protein